MSSRAVLGYPRSGWSQGSRTVLTPRSLGVPRDDTLCLPSMLLEMRARILLGAAAMLLVVVGCARAPRAVQNLNGDWRFIRRDVAGGERSDVDDPAWQGGER